jgi:hypothetical protein
MVAAGTPPGVVAGRLRPKGDSLAGVNAIEWLADRIPRGLVRPASLLGVACAALGSALLFAGVVFGSIAWTLAGLGAFVAAAFLWHLVVHASEIGRVALRSDM